VVAIESDEAFDVSEGFSGRLGFAFAPSDRGLRMVDEAFGLIGGFSGKLDFAFAPAD
jgi:hypothetical protein